MFNKLILKNNKINKYKFLNINNYIIYLYKIHYEFFSDYHMSMDFFKIIHLFEQIETFIKNSS